MQYVLIPVFRGQIGDIFTEKFFPINVDVSEFVD